MKRKIIRQVEIEYEVDIDIDKMKYKNDVTSTEWLKSQIISFHHLTRPSVPSIQEYCDRVSFVEPTYTSDDKNAHVYSDIKAKIVRDMTISNEEI